VALILLGLGAGPHIQEAEGAQLIPVWYMQGACSQDPGLFGSTGFATRIEIQRNQRGTLASGMSYWIGTHLRDGSFIQVGYRIRPTSAVGEDVSPFATYFPPGSSLDTTSDPNLDLVGPVFATGTFHWFNMTMDTPGVWTFRVDGTPFFNVTTTPLGSKATVFVGSEVSQGTIYNELRAARFFPAALYRDGQGTWHAPQSAKACYHYQSDGNPCTPAEGVLRPYAVGKGPTGFNDILSGRGAPCVQSTARLW